MAAMSHGQIHVVLIVMLVWAVAVAIKAARCLGTGTPYVFGIWDGGLLRQGRQLDRTRTVIKLVIVSLVVAFGGVMAAGIHLPRNSIYVLMVLVVASLVSDLTSSTKEPSDG
jgi:hypothetical protein